MRFDSVIQNQAKSLVIVMALMFALFLLPLYWRRRRYLVEHLVFATHFYSFFLLLLLALRFAVAPSSARRTGSASCPGISTSTLRSPSSPSPSAARTSTSRSAGSTARGATLLKCLALVFSAAVIIQTYRFALFFTAFYSV